MQYNVLNSLTSVPVLLCSELLNIRTCTVQCVVLLDISTCTSQCAVLPRYLAVCTECCTPLDPGIPVLASVLFPPVRFSLHHLVLSGKVLSHELQYLLCIINHIL